MLISFSVENYKSYKDPVIFNMTPGGYRKKKEHLIKKKNANILKFSSIYGGNASGKSNFVDAIRVTKNMIVNGKINNPYKELYFKLDESQKEKPSNFEVEVSIGEKIFAYGFSVNFNKNLVLKEYLYESKSNKVIFDFDYDNKKYFNIMSIQKKSNSKKIDVYIDEYKKNKRNFFLKYIYSKNLDKTEAFFNNICSVFEWFNDTLTVITPTTAPIDMIGLFKENENKNIIQMIDLIKSFDTGITSYLEERLSLDKFISKIKTRLIATETQNELEDLIEDIEELEENETMILIIQEKYYKIYKRKNKPIIENLTFRHCNLNCASFELSEESDGTKRLIELIHMIYFSQFKNKVFIVDEINRSLHANLTVDFVNKFIELSKSTESQLIITTHESSLMDLDILRQDEIWVVDRYTDGSSNMISMSKYSIRSDKVLNKDYLLGRYGGVPQLLKILNKPEKSNA